MSDSALLEDRTIGVVKDGVVHDVHMQAWFEGADRYRLHVEGPFGAHESTSWDLFEALTQIRQQVEPAGWRFLVHGARRDTYPSGMQRDQAGGRRVYLLRSGRPVSTEDILDTFGAAALDTLGTVAEQEESWKSWRAQSHE